MTQGAVILTHTSTRFCRTQMTQKAVHEIRTAMQRATKALGSQFSLSAQYRQLHRLPSSNTCSLLILCQSMGQYTPRRTAIEKTGPHQVMLAPSAVPQNGNQGDMKRMPPNNTRQVLKHHIHLLRAPAPFRSVHIIRSTQQDDVPPKCTTQSMPLYFDNKDPRGTECTGRTPIQKANV